MRGFPGDVSRSRCNSTHHDEHEVDEGDPNLPLGAETEFPFKRFMVTKLVRLFVVQELVLTMKRLKETITAPWHEQSKLRTSSTS